MTLSKEALWLGGASVVVVALVAWGMQTDTTCDSYVCPTSIVTIGEVEVRVAVVDTLATRQQGLSNIPGLAPDEGMLFVFEEDDHHSFWMKDMLFPIDIMWIAADGRIVHIEHSVKPETFPATFTPSYPARFVLEVPSGFVKRHEVDIGSIVSFE